MYIIGEDWSVEMKTLIIIPAYNEEENIERVVNMLVTSYPQYDYVVVNDCSKDNTKFICEKNNYNFIDLSVNLGLAGAVQAGYKYAYHHNYDIAIQYDGDGQHQPEYIEDLVHGIESGADDRYRFSALLTQKNPMECPYDWLSNYHLCNKTYNRC